MEGTPAIYQGRILSQMDKDNFRAYIYSNDGKKKLVNSWDEFECHMESGIWFSKAQEENKVEQDKKIKPLPKDTKNEVLLGHKK